MLIFNNYRVYDINSRSLVQTNIGHTDSIRSLVHIPERQQVQLNHEENASLKFHSFPWRIVGVSSVMGKWTLKTLLRYALFHIFFNLYIFGQPPLERTLEAIKAIYYFANLLFAIPLLRQSQSVRLFNYEPDSTDFSRTNQICCRQKQTFRKKCLQSIY